MERGEKHSCGAPGFRRCYASEAPSGDMYISSLLVLLLPLEMVKHEREARKVPDGGRWSSQGQGRLKPSPLQQVASLPLPGGKRTPAL